MRSSLIALALGMAPLTLGLSNVAAADPIGGASSTSQHVTAPAGAARPAAALKAGTSVVLGSVAPAPASAIACSLPLTIVQAPASTSPSYTATTAGVITSFSHNANGAAGQLVRAVFMVPSAPAGHYTQVGRSAVRAVTPSSLNTFATRVPVPAGAVLGMQFSNAASACAFIAGGNSVYASSTFNPDTQTSFAATYAALPNERLNASAVLESDADRDGYGDVTQDACPESALTHGPCPAAPPPPASGPAPDTIIKKKPAKIGHDRTIKIRFESTIPGSTFRCSLDGNTLKGCSSPYAKRLGFGHHKVKIQAISPRGVADPTPATVRFRITR